ncbi:hypothetical protein CXB51_015436 [Gossypium anomalum]|uniref:DUF7745 domain-containing protein n=1 Tax=Gossypium anomalum TaxID=47600 RepID=A0A8J5Z889_9ROSI|nr:hypothetical protein CXB51_015436 [Gossypium anomalum]
MENGFFDKVEDNAAVRIWAETTQQEKGDSLTEGYVSELLDFTRVSVTQNNLQEMKEIWGQWDDEIKRLFYCHYGDLPYLLDVKIDERLFRALVQYWNSAYSCFTFGKVDLVPTTEEYTALIRCPKIQVDRIYSKAANGPAFSKRLMNITGMSEQWVTARIKQKGGCRCIPWRNLRDLILAHPDIKKRVDVFALSIYGLVIFPKALGHIDEAISDLFYRLSKGTAPEENVEWRAPWMVPDEILYRYGEFDWVPLLGIWGTVRYAPLLTRRMKKFAANPMTTLEYDQWRIQRINDNIPTSDQEVPRSMKECLRVIPSELEIIRHDFERKSLELEKRIEQLEEEKMQLGLDCDVQKLEAERIRKGKNKAEEDLDSLKTDYKKL